jgi:hypothetical protein
MMSELQSHHEEGGLWVLNTWIPVRVLGCHCRACKWCYEAFLNASVAAALQYNSSSSSSSQLSLLNQQRHARIGLLCVRGFVSAVPQFHNYVNTGVHAPVLCEQLPARGFSV